MISEILLVEDDDNDAELTLRALREGNLVDVIRRVRDGLEALEYVFRQGTFEHRTGGLPTLILLDLRMPRVDGIEMLQTLRSDKLTESIPVIVLTSSTDEMHRADANRLDVSYVLKPLSHAAFAQVVARMGLD
ncbi:MAG: response regulator [Steroidobacteraceae bacterium]